MKLYNKENIYNLHRLIEYVLYRDFKTLSRQERQDIEFDTYRTVIEQDLNIPKTYVCTIARNIGLTYINRKNLPIYATFQSHEETYEQRYDDLIETMAKKLSKLNSQIFVLMLDGYTQEEIAERLQISQPAVHYRYESLKRELNDIMYK